MSLLARLETDLREALARAFTDSAVSLVDIGRALLAEDEGAGPTEGPRVFDVALAPADLEGLRAHAGALCRRLGELVRDQRAQRSGSRGGPVDVRLEPDRSLSGGVFRVRSSAHDAGRPGDPGGSHVIAARGRTGAPAASGGTGSEPLPGRPRLVVALGGSVVSGTQYAEGEAVELDLDEHVAVVGCAPDANLLLPAGVVAPHHVEVHYREDGYHEARAVGDAPLRVNGQPGRRGLLTDGARLEMGDITVVYRRDLTGRETRGESREGATRTDARA